MPQSPHGISSPVLTVSASNPPGLSRHNQKPILPHRSAPVQSPSTTAFKIDNNFGDLFQHTLSLWSPQAVQGTILPIRKAEDWDDILASSLAAALMVQKLVDDTPEEHSHVDQVSLPRLQTPGPSCWTSSHTVKYDLFGDIPSPVSEVWIADNGYSSPDIARPARPASAMSPVASSAPSSVSGKNEPSPTALIFPPFTMWIIFPSRQFDAVHRWRKGALVLALALALALVPMLPSLSGRSMQ
ncbi:uncharacterized protein ARMOST_08293 [Armillaria ostoyae]|uniref:Uncharacterized protein n=1 Tax=Armillaria ostoyae TaxID=47428 RepID=A0A284R876_ARMOS|nr:uncharacterized protein ARMOST_08293 [Armillaria ostoyae]